MNNYSDDLIRINKTVAKKMYNNGVEVLFIPCQMNPCNNYFNSGVWMNKSKNIDFNTLLKQFTYYNCNYAMGYYTSFYVKKIEV